MEILDTQDPVALLNFYISAMQDIHAGGEGTVGVQETAQRFLDQFNELLANPDLTLDMVNAAVDECVATVKLHQCR